jgi:phosphoribosylaminoimidazolecarboxamide formyltransferase/IMP cyclohydrolase
MPTALFSVSDKSGLIEFAQGLQTLGWHFIASGGTAQAIRDAGLEITDVADYTGSPEILKGRVKTLHPAVHGGILARNTSDDAADLARIHAVPIDLVVVNLYPFQQTIERSDPTLEEAIENIDIGGVALIRAAAKNYERVTVLIDPSDYPKVLQELETNGTVSLETRSNLSRKAFSLTAQYDTAIAAYLDHSQVKEMKQTSDKNEHEKSDAGLAGDAEPLVITLYPIQNLRYGENPHQEATLYGYSPKIGPLGGQLLQGKPLSYNNLLDLDAAWRAVVSFEKDAVVIIKHLSPCGIATAENLEEAYTHALESDPVSAFGGVIAVNRPFDRSTAKALGQLFVECIIAPGFTPKAMEILSERKNLRLVSLPDLAIAPLFELRSVNQGVLVQDVDLGDPLTKSKDDNWKTVTERKPTEEELRALRFAWKAVQHAKSNAIVFARISGSSEATVGIGSGQPNRVDCVRIAATRAAERARGAVMASDAFFPFSDSVQEAAKAGITAIVQPGGSVRDQESIDVANANDIAMVFSGVRHFRH